jgi:hypothetical protein
MSSLLKHRRLASPPAAYDTLFGAAYTRHDETRRKVALYCNAMSEATIGAIDGLRKLASKSS